MQGYTFTKCVLCRANREVEQTQLVRVRVTSLFVDDVFIICVPRTWLQVTRLHELVKCDSTRFSS